MTPWHNDGNAYISVILWLSVSLVEEISVPGEIYQSNGKYLTNFKYVKLYQIYLPTCRNKIPKLKWHISLTFTRPCPPKITSLIRTDFYCSWCDLIRWGSLYNLEQFLCNSTFIVFMDLYKICYIHLHFI